MTDYRALHAYAGTDASEYDARRFLTMKGRLTDRLEWRLLRRGLAALQARTGGRLVTVIDIPVGTGRMAIRLKGAGFAVTAVDASASMLEVAKDKGAADSYVLGRAEAIPVEAASVDAVVCARLLGHLPLQSKEQALREFARVARHGAVVFFAADTRWLRLRRRFEARRGRNVDAWQPVAVMEARGIAETAGFRVIRVMRLLGPISETRALVCEATEANPVS